MDKGNKKTYTHLLIVTKTNRGKITQKAKVVAYKGWKNGAKRLQEGAVFVWVWLFISFDFCNHVNVLHIQKIKPNGKGEKLKLKANEPNCMSAEHHNHTEGKIKHQETHKHFLKKSIFKFIWLPTCILGQDCRGKGTARRSQALRFVFDSGKWEAILKLSLMYDRTGEMRKGLVREAQIWDGGDKKGACGDGGGMKV